jgi:hypothetical protein
MFYSVEVSDGIYDLYESGFRDITAITASIASKLVHQRKNNNLVSTSTTSAAVEPAAKKSKMTRYIPIDISTILSDNFIVQSFDETVVDKELSLDVDQNADHLDSERESQEMLLLRMI